MYGCSWVAVFWSTSRLFRLAVSLYLVLLSAIAHATSTEDGDEEEVSRSAAIILVLPGGAEVCNDDLRATLLEDGRRDIFYIDLSKFAQGVTQGTLPDRPALFIGGGYAVEMAESLSPVDASVKSKATTLIRHLVGTKGALYTGICAGAILASAGMRITEPNGSQFVIDEWSPLGLSQVISHHFRKFGPPYPVASNLVDVSATRRLAVLSVEHIPTWCALNASRLSIYWNQGPYFPTEAFNNEQDTTYAYHDDLEDGSTPIAIASCSFGQGRVLLWSCHPELDLKRWEMGTEADTLKSRKLLRDLVTYEESKIKYHNAVKPH